MSNEGTMEDPEDTAEVWGDEILAFEGDDLDD